MQFHDKKDDGIKHFNLTASGGGGDHINALPLVKKLGGGIIHGVPKSHLSFYKRQPYIFDATTYHDKGMLLWGYSIIARYHRKIKCLRSKESLLESHFLVHNLPVPSLEEINNEIIPWLIADKLNTEIPIVVHRTNRYRDNVDWSFLKKFKGKIVCVGFKKEALPFVRQYKARWLKTDDIDELAMVINSAQVFIGNQSTPLALAIGLGKSRMVEEFKNINYHHNKNAILAAYNYYKSLGNECPLASSIFNSKNESIMTNDANKNYVIVKKLLDHKLPKYYNATME